MSLKSRSKPNSLKSFCGVVGGWVGGWVGGQLYIGIVPDYGVGYLKYLVGSSLPFV